MSVQLDPGGKQQRTKAMPAGGVDPRWVSAHNNYLVFQSVQLDASDGGSGGAVQLKSVSLTLRVLNENVAVDDVIGSTIVTLTKNWRHSGVRQSYTLDTGGSLMVRRWFQALENLLLNRVCKLQLELQFFCLFVDLFAVHHLLLPRQHRYDG